MVFSFLGVLLLLVCTPLGFVKLFTLVGFSLSPIVSSPHQHCFLQVAELVTRQQFLSDLTEEYQVAVMEEAAVKKQLDSKGTSGCGEMTLANGYDGSVPSVREYFSLMTRYISVGQNISRSSTLKPSPRERS